VGSNPGPLHFIYFLIFITLPLSHSGSPIFLHLYLLPGFANSFSGGRTCKLKILMFEIIDLVSSKLKVGSYVRYYVKAQERCVKVTYQKS
jgi:hypothetical protein